MLPTTFHQCWRQNFVHRSLSWKITDLFCICVVPKGSSHTSAMPTSQGCGVQSPPLEIDSMYSLALSIFNDIMSAWILLGIPLWAILAFSAQWSYHISNKIWKWTCLFSRYGYMNHFLKLKWDSFLNSCAQSLIIVWFGPCASCVECMEIIVKCHEIYSVILRVNETLHFSIVFIYLQTQIIYI